MKIVADLSIPLRFNGPQPNAYGVEQADSEPVRAGSLVGDTRQGGSVNFEQYSFIPHCNGTHTECVGHITDERISIRECLQDMIEFSRFIHEVDWPMHDVAHQCVFFNIKEILNI